MNAKYLALREALARMNSSLNGGAMLASPYKPEDADKVYQMMAELIPSGTRVRATYVPNPSKPTEIVTREGVVASHAPISIDEPDFHINLSDFNGTILLPGSVLEAI
jgi:hypothetical protein